MTVLTVRAQDTATAMEEIVEKLGKDSYIVGTKKIGNEMLVKATNNPKKINKTIKKGSERFNNIISKELENNTTFEENNFKKNYDDTVTKNLVNQKSKDIFKEMSTEFKEFKNFLNGMVITDMAGLSPNLKNTAKVKLQNMGFSDYLLMKFRKNIRNDDSDQGIQDFIKELAEIFTIDDPINSLISSQYIFVVGASGSGKTSFSAKLAATLVQDIKNYSVVLSKLGKQNEFLNDNLKSYSRLINVPNLSILPENACKKFEEIDKKVIIDVSSNSNTTTQIINNLKKRVGSNKILTILIIPSGSNKYYLKKQIDNYRNMNPIIAFTKLDENFVSPEELSVLAENECSIGYLTDTQSILKSINFVNKEILAQYLKDNLSNLSM